MQKYVLITTIIAFAFLSCSKDEGEGGQSSVGGKVHLIDKSGANQGDYDAPDYDVYILYGEKDNIYDDKMKTNYDGSFKFKNLRKGSYRVYAYSVDATAVSGVVPIFKSIDIGGKEDGDVGTIEVVK